MFHGRSLFVESAPGTSLACRLPLAPPLTRTFEIFENRYCALVRPIIPSLLLFLRHLYQILKPFSFPSILLATKHEHDPYPVYYAAKQKQVLKMRAAYKKATV